MICLISTLTSTSDVPFPTAEQTPPAQHVSEAFFAWTETCRSILADAAARGLRFSPGRQEAQGLQLQLGHMKLLGSKGRWQLPQMMTLLLGAVRGT